MSSVQAILQTMTLEEKCALLSGATVFQTRALPRCGCGRALRNILRAGAFAPA